MTDREVDVSRPSESRWSGVLRTVGLDLWFMTNIETHKLDDLMADPHVNLAYYKDSSREWVSVAGMAMVSTDRELVLELYKPDWKAWLGDEGGDGRTVLQQLLIRIGGICANDKGTNGNRRHQDQGDG